MGKKTITILGSTGSIGTNTVDVIKENKNYFAQSQLIKWSPPNKEDVRRRFCQDREQAQKLAESLQEQGYFVSIKQDGIGFK